MLTFVEAVALPPEKPAPAMGRCRELAREYANYQQHPGVPGEDYEIVVRKGVEEALHKVFEQGTADIITAVERARVAMLGPSVPFTDQRKDRK